MLFNSLILKWSIFSGESPYSFLIHKEQGGEVRVAGEFIFERTYSTTLDAILLFTYLLHNCDFTLLYHMHVI